MSGLVEVAPSPEEIDGGQWSDGNLRKIIEALRNDGLVVLKDVIDPNHLDELNKMMVPDAIRIRKETDRLNFGTENIQQAAPLQHENLIYDDVFANPLLHEAVLHVLGPGSRWNFSSGNTAMPQSSQKQPVHADEMCPDMTSPFMLIANIPLIDSSPDTGSTQLWPGSHLLRDPKYYVDGNGRALPECQEAHAKVRPPVQPTVKKGSIIVRDLTLWHCGMPNPSEHVRCMLGLGFTAKWWHNKSAVKVPNESVGDYLQTRCRRNGITVETTVVDDYNNAKDAHDFDLGESGQGLYEREVLAGNM